MARVQETEGAHAVESARRHVLQESTEEFAAAKGHDFALAVAAVAVTEGDSAVVTGDNALVRQCSPVDITSKVMKKALRFGLCGSLGVDNPVLAPGNRGELHLGQGAAREVEKASSKALGEGADGDEEVGATGAADSLPSTPVGIEPAAGDEHVKMRMPFKGPRPGVKDGDGADVRAKISRIQRKGRERLEGGAEEDIEQDALMRAHEPAQLGGQGEDEMEIGDGQKCFALPFDPFRGGIESAARTGAMTARMKDQMRGVALRPASMRCVASLWRRV